MKSQIKMAVAVFAIYWSILIYVFFMPFLTIVFMLTGHDLVGAAHAKMHEILNGIQAWGRAE